MSMQLQRIQKTFRVFYTLTRIAKTLCIVGASFCAAGAACAATMLHGGQVFGLFGEPLEVFTGAVDLKQMYVVLSAVCVQLIGKAILLAFAQSYLKAEQEDGTPFTEQGADRLKLLGIRCIWISIAAVAAAVLIVTLLGAKDGGTIGNRTEVITGIVLILASMIFRYGAELERKPRITE